MNAAPPSASGLSPAAAQVLGGLPQVNWTDLFAQLMGMGKQDNTLANLMMPGGSIPQLGPIMPKPRIPVAPAKAPVVPVRAAAPNPTAGLVEVGQGIYMIPQAMGMHSYGQGGGMGMDVGGQGAFGDMGAFGTGYGDTY